MIAATAVAATTSAISAASFVFVMAGIIVLFFRYALYAFALLVPPFLELLFLLDFLEIMLRRSGFADLVFFCLLLHENSCQWKGAG